MTSSGAELLLIDLTGPLQAEAWRQALSRAGVASSPGPACCLHRDVAAVQALDRLTLADVHLVVCGPAAPLLQALGPLLHAWHREPPGPVSVFCSEAGPGQLPAELPSLVQCGLTGWWPEAAQTQPAALSAILATDRARWTREASTRFALRQTQLQLDERKWVDRAKGVLMQARSDGQMLGEEDAFRLLRSAAMQSGLRVGEVSRAVFESAQWADAINRAGQLRMLSQRLVKLAAQRLAGVDARRARTLQHQATLRVQNNLDHLASLPALARHDAQAGGSLLPALLARTLAAWHDLRPALAERQTPASLAAIDVHAEALLQAAEALTTALEVQGGRQALRVINLCGRQRMRVQRLAKAALLADLLNEPSRHEPLVALLDEFEATLQELERAPLTSPEIRQNLGAARDEWLRLMRGLRTTTGAGFGSSPGAFSTDPRAALASSADLLLDLFDQLTTAYEHSLQVIMG